MPASQSHQMKQKKVPDFNEAIKTTYELELESCESSQPRPNLNNVTVFGFH